MDPTTIYTFSCEKGFLFLFFVLGPKANFLQLVSAHVIVAHSKNRVCDGLLEKFNSLHLLIFFYLKITPPRIDEENNFPLLFFLLIFPICLCVK